MGEHGPCRWLVQAGTWSLHTANVTLYVFCQLYSQTCYQPPPLYAAAIRLLKTQTKPGSSVRVGRASRNGHNFEEFPAALWESCVVFFRRCEY